MSSNSIPVNFYGSTKSVTPTNRGRSSAHDQLASLDKKIDGLFNILTEQNQQMVALKEQGEQTLLKIGGLDGRLGALEGKLEDLEKCAHSSISCSSSEGVKKGKTRLPPGRFVYVNYTIM